MSKVRVFEPSARGMREMYLRPHQRSKVGKNPLAWRGVIVVGDGDDHCAVALQAMPEPTMVRVETTQARRVADAAMAVQAVHAMVALGCAGKDEE